MTILETDLAALDAFCRSRVPAEVADRARVIWTRRGKTVTVLEGSSLGPNGTWIDVPVARIKYDDSLGGLWTLYWFDRNSKAHRYEFLHPQRQLKNVLREIERDPTCIFWG